MYKYNKPESVRSPKTLIKSVTPIFDGGEESYSIAVLNWNGKECIGIRWNITENEWVNEKKREGIVNCIGEPNSRGYSTWFILPDDFLPGILTGKGKISRQIQNALKHIDFINSK